MELNGEGFFFHASRLGDLEERRKLPSGGPQPKTILVLCGRDRTPLTVMFVIIMSCHQTFVSPVEVVGSSKYIGVQMLQ